MVLPALGQDHVLLMPPMHISCVFIRIQRDIRSLDNGRSSRQALLGDLRSLFFLPSRVHSFRSSSPRSHHQRLSLHSAPDLLLSIIGLNIDLCYGVYALIKGLSTRYSPIYWNKVFELVRAAGRQRFYLGIAPAEREENPL